jgi:hypothetical protein
MLILGCEISSLLDKKLARWSTASCALALAYQSFVSKRKRKMIVFYYFIFGAKGDVKYQKNKLSKNEYLLPNFPICTRLPKLPMLERETMVVMFYPSTLNMILGV